MNWTGLAFAVVVVLIFVAATERGRDEIALGFARGVVRVDRVVGAANAYGVRALRAFAVRAGVVGAGGAAVVLAPSQAAAAEAVIQGEGATGLVDCMRTPYRIVRVLGAWGVAALPPWLAFLGTTTCEHGGHAENVAAEQDLAARQAHFAPRDALEESLARSFTDMDAVAAFHQAFRESEVWLVGAGVNVGSDGASSTVRFTVVPWQGRDMIPVFTGDHRVPPVPPGTTVGKVTVRMLLGVLPDQPPPLVINPGSALPLVMEPGVVRQLQQASPSV